MEAFTNFAIDGTPTRTRAAPGNDGQSNVPFTNERSHEQPRRHRNVNPKPHVPQQSHACRYDPQPGDAPPTPEPRYDSNADADATRHGRQARNRIVVSCTWSHKYHATRRKPNTRNRKRNYKSSKYHRLDSSSTRSVREPPRRCRSKPRRKSIRKPIWLTEPVHASATTKHRYEYDVEYHEPHIYI